MNIDDLEEYFSEVTLSRARSIVSEGKVVPGSVSKIDDSVILGEVRGTASLPYEVEIQFFSDDVLAVCTCPVVMFCKHSAAVLMVWEANNNTKSLSNTSASTRRAAVAEILDEDPQILGWLDNLTQALESKSAAIQANAAETHDNYVYELYALRDSEGPTLGARITRLNRRRDGTAGKGRVYALTDTFGYYDADVSESDEVLFDYLRTMAERHRPVSQGHAVGAIPLRGSFGAHLLQQLLASGKLYWQSEHDNSCKKGADKQVIVRWSEEGDNGEKIRINTNLHENGKLYLSNTQPVYYLDPDKHEIGLIDSEYSARLLNAVTLAPELPSSAAQAVSNLLATAAQNQTLPLPAEPTIRFSTEPMICQLRLYSADGTAHVKQWVVQIMMCYGEHQFHVELNPQTRTNTVELEDGTEIEITREHDQEYRQYQFFRRRVAGFETVYARDPKRFTIADHQPLCNSDTERFKAFERMFDAFETLEQEHFRIIVEEPVSLDAEIINDFGFNLQPVDNGWFDLGLQLKHEDKRYDLLPLILDWLARGDRQRAVPLNVVTDDGRRLSVPAAMIEPVAETLLELYDDSFQQLSLTRARAASLTKLGREMAEVGAVSEFSGDKTLLALAEKVDRISVDQQALIKSAKPPRALKAELRAYQLTGMAWLNFLHEASFCGVLADDMGLGKTVQTLAHLLSLKQRSKLKGPCLVVAPTSVVHNWARESERFAPILRARTWHGSDRHEIPLEQDSPLLVITSYALILRDYQQLSSYGFAHLVLDEAQVIKNPAAKITQALKQMPIENRLCLTGTPLENHLGELWSLFDFLMPGLLGSKKRFTQHFRTPIEKHGDTDRHQRLNNAIAPFLLRRRKQTVAAELPAKTEIIQKIELGADQARLYETIRVGMEKRVRKLLQERGVAKSHIEMLDALLKLRQSCCHPDLVKLDSARKVRSSAKTEYVLEMIDELVAEGRKILLFSQFTQMLDILEREVKSRGIAYVKLTGRTRKRQEVVDAFQAGNVPLFLISLKAGGTGLNLTAADTVIHYDPWWNPAAENQATDRAHRIGQDKPVFVYKLIADNTVEDKIVAMQARKQALADATVERGDANPVRSLSADDILALFADT